MMTQYAYSPDTGELIQTVIPAPWMGTTDIAPPTYDPAVQSVFFVSGQWVLSDHDPAGDLGAYKAAQTAKLADACKSQIYAGFTSSALGSPYIYPAKDKDQANLSASVLASTLPGLPAGWTTPFWCMESIGTWAFVSHTAAQIQQVGLDGKAAVVAALEKNTTLAAQVQAATDIAAVLAVVW